MDPDYHDYHKPSPIPDCSTMDYSTAESLYRPGPGAGAAVADGGAGAGEGAGKAPPTYNYAAYRPFEQQRRSLDLPEVVPGTAPEVQSPQDAARRCEPGAPEPMYPVQADKSPKFVDLRRSAARGDGDGDGDGDLLSPMSPEVVVSPETHRGGAGGAGDGRESLSAVEVVGVGLGLGAGAGGDGVAGGGGSGGTVSRKSTGSEKAEDRRREILGLETRKFWVVALLIIMVIAVGVGAGVGGGLAASQASRRGANDGAGGGAQVSSSGLMTSASTAMPASSATAPSTGSASATATAATSAGAGTGASASAKATPLADYGNHTQPQVFEFRGWTEHEHGGRTTGEWNLTGTAEFPANITSYTWQHNGDRDCCITMCDGARWSGWWCQYKDQNASSGHGFSRFFIGCGDLKGAANDDTNCGYDVDHQGKFIDEDKGGGDKGRVRREARSWLARWIGL